MAFYFACSESGSEPEVPEEPSAPAAASPTRTHKRGRSHAKTPWIPIVGVILLAGICALLFAFFGTDDGGNTETWSGVSVVEGVTPRMTKLGDVADKLGEYEEVGTYGNNLEWVRYRDPEHDIASLTVWLDANRTVRWARTVPASPVTVDALAGSMSDLESVVSITEGNRFGGKGNHPGELHSYGEYYLYVEAGAVKQIWRIPAAMPHDTLLLEMYGVDAGPVDVSRTGVDPR